MALIQIRTGDNFWMYLNTDLQYLDTETNIIMLLLLFKGT